MARTFDPVIHRLIRALRKALPDASEEDLYWSYHFLSGALTLSLSQTGRIDRLSNGLCKSSDFASIHRRMAPFIASGFERLCKPAVTAARASARRAAAP
jgi:Tetracyclin repressor-like, C-terminal domain